ncbi:MAG: 50S ribosomal protein L2 [Elusimicrobiota bacterium]
MGIKTYRPYTPSRRFITTLDNRDVITKKKPMRKLTVALRKQGGRNNTGQLMVRHQGGGHKQRYRIIDFRRDKLNMPAVVNAIEYDPIRSALIALVKYEDGTYKYILHPIGLKVGDIIMSGENIDIRVGNALPLDKIPEGTMVHNIEILPGKGGVMVRSAGATAQVMAKEGEYAHLRMPSGETRMVLLRCMATIGQVGNIEHENVVLGKAGRSRHIGIRPTVRGTKMNSVDHPHGGGRGHSKGGNHPQSPWGQPAKGYRTRKKKVWDQFIIRRRQDAKVLG